MKKKTLLKSIWILLVMCGVSANAGAQDLKSILTGVAKAAIGNKATTAHSIVGTWSEIRLQQLLPLSAHGHTPVLNVSSKVKTCWQKPVVKWLPRKWKRK